MASQSIESYRNGAEVVSGDDLCKKKSIQLLEELCLPKGLFPLEDMEEFGYNREAGFVWLIQKKKKDHVFKQIKRAVSYAPQTKELLLWLSVVEVYFDKPTSEKLTFKTGTGLSDSFPASAFDNDRNQLEYEVGHVGDFNLVKLHKNKAGLETRLISSVHFVVRISQLYLTNDGDESNTSNDVFYVYFDLAIATNESIF
ncbi:hypothetical protein HPP92_026359 [Vanilla planifolia]|uniref:Uncharacterized protein n=1 Tax=Vanilla planifolia TaxID=51239 RepID=A0A835PGW2_VANPL|nr:hypothetical protein HPP92_026359 [Vanilla planifolia]